MKIQLYNITQFNIVELSLTENPNNFCPATATSRFLDTEVFNLFVHCFEKSHKLYNYDEPVRYSPRQIVALLNALKEELNLLAGIESLDAFESWICQKFMGKQFLEILSRQDPSWTERWKKVWNEVYMLNHSLTELVNSCISDDKTLWVKGY